MSAVEFEHGGAVLGGHRGVVYERRSKPIRGLRVAVQSWAGRPPVRIWVGVALPAWGARGARGRSGRRAGGVEGLADLAAGQADRVGLQRGLDLFGEQLAGRAVQRPAGGAGGVVVERERSLEVRRADLPFAVGEGVEEREADRVRLGAGGDLTEHTGRGWASCGRRRARAHGRRGSGGHGRRSGRA